MQTEKKTQVHYHLIFWLIYTLTWSARDLIYHPDFGNNVISNTIFNLIMGPFVYFNVSWLIPKFLFPKRWSTYLIWFILVFVVATIVRFYSYRIYFESIGAMTAVKRFYSVDGVVILSSENIFLFTLTSALFIIREWYLKEKYAHELERKNTESELNLLKGQLQPHYLFNNLNTIYFLMEKNPSLAKDVMIRFSDILSHQLYNASKDFVPLKEEITNVQNYIELQKIRHEDFVTVTIALPEEVPALDIAPMILLTFVENAFKHGQREKGYGVNVSLKVVDATLHFKVTNSIGDTPASKGGVGLENVRRRLALIYPNRHSLSAERAGEEYRVDLTITLHRDG
jgi:two-component system, LytTR family, sensor kinase